MADGTVQNGPLKSNTRYFIKVRAVKRDQLDTAIISYSKYAGPVDTRTEFSQEDYDQGQKDENKTAVFLDKISTLEKGLYWEVTASNPSASSILVKSDQLIEALDNSGSYPVVLDVSAIKSGASESRVYIPAVVIEELNDKNKSITIRTEGAEFSLRPGTIDTGNDKVIKDLKSDADTKEIFYELTITRENRVFRNMPAGTKIVIFFPLLSRKALFNNADTF
jgi:hypothetical protein